jgi:hypothetical protein
MSLSIKINNPDFPEGHEWGVNGLGAFVNGTARDISKEEEQTFVDLTLASAKDSFSNDPNIEVTGTATAKVPTVEETQETMIIPPEEGGDN